MKTLINKKRLAMPIIPNTKLLYQQLLEQNHLCKVLCSFLPTSPHLLPLFSFPLFYVYITSPVPLRSYAIALSRIN